MATIGVTYNMLQIWGVNVDDIIRVANENTPRLRPVHYATMAEMLSDVFGDDNTIENDNTLSVCTNYNKVQGAIAILYPGVADEIRKQIGDFYVLPSSIHETLIVPKKITDDVNELYNMVHDVNATEVSPDEILGNDVYEVINGELVSVMHHGTIIDATEDIIV